MEEKEKDEMDELMDMDLDDADSVKVPKKKRRVAGFAMDSAPPLKVPKAGKAKASAQPKSIAGPVTDAAASGAASAAGGGSSSAKAVKKSELDHEMQIVAQKHLSTESGSSTKALEGLIVPNYLATGDGKRYSITARVRGVS